MKPTLPFARMSELNDEPPDEGVTEDMVDEGLRALYESGAIENWMEGPDRLLIRRIFVAMRRKHGDGK
jgi:hypothetical protein